MRYKLEYIQNVHFEWNFQENKVKVHIFDKYFQDLALVHRLTVG